jgi:hypothetical protein
MKTKFQKEPVLLMPDPTKPFIVESDASKYASGAVLRQQDGNGDWHPCSYISKSFSETERNYEIYDRELLAIIRALTEWRHYLIGTKEPVTVLTDHKNLTFFRSAQKLNRRQARWSLILSDYNLKLIHVPGKQMIQSDALSRRPDLCPEEDTDNIDKTLLPEQLFIQTIDQELKELISESIKQDVVITEALTALKTNGPLPMKSTLHDWKIEEELIFFKDKCYVPLDEELRRKITQKYHDSLTAGHPGHLRTKELILRDYWWPGLDKFVKNYVEGCAVCQQHKINRHPTNPPLMPIKSEGTRPYSLITMDFITDLPTSEGYDSIMVVVDHGSTKGVILEPCNKTIDALGTAELLLNTLYRRFGLPDKTISDRGPQFASHVFQELGKLLGIKIAMSTAHHPQTDGATERSNQEIEAYLSIFCGNNPSAWRSLLPTLEFTYNSKPHASQKHSPAYLLMGFDPVSIPTAYPKTNVPSVQERLSLLDQARNEAHAAHDLARQKMMQKITRNFVPFKLGDKVWLESKHLKLRYESKKLAPKREGPFTIIEVMGPLTYKLQLPTSWRVHPVIHATLLSPYKENSTHGRNFNRPPPDLIDGEHEYEIEAIIAHKKKGRGFQYLVKWKDYATAENTWEPEKNITHAEDVLSNYKRRHNLA